MKTPKKSRSQSKPRVNPVPAGSHTVTPHLVCAGAANAMTFYKKAFGASELGRLADANGRLMYGAMRIGDSTIMLNDEFPEMGALGPKARGGASVTIHLFVPDADASFARAVKAGAVVRMPIADMFWGDRYGMVEDPFGHNWSIATRRHNLTPRQIKAAFQAACG